MEFSERANYYNLYRKADKRLTSALIKELNLAMGSCIVDIGAGTGNYSIALMDEGYNVISVEPEISMIKQCKDDRLKWVVSSASHIPLKTGSANGAVLVNVIHHFHEMYSSIAEINRIVGDGPIVIVTFDPEISCKQWIFDYWPMFIKYEKNCYMRIDELKSQLSSITNKTVEEHVFGIPHDFEDVFAATLWSRPEYILDNIDIRYAMSIFSSLSNEDYISGYERLKKEFLSRKWHSKYSKLLKDSIADVGCRILTVK